MSYKNLTSAKIKANIKSIDGARQKLVDSIQQTALAVAYHAHVHGDITLAIELARAVGNGMKHEALRLWMEAFAPVDAVDEGVFTFNKEKRVSDEELEALMLSAEGKNWYDYKTEKPADQFSLGALLAALNRKVEKAQTKGVEMSEAEQDAARVLRELQAKVPAPAKGDK